MKIIGRKREIRELDHYVETDKSEFIVVYGRRRVGKTFLIREYFNNEFAFQVTGIHDGSKEMQLANFGMALGKYFGTRSLPRTWLDAFSMLQKGLDELKTEGKKVVFIDEMPWMETQKSDFLRAFEAFWNGYAAWTHDILLIVCGSATTWLTDNILNNIGGLYNRCTGRLFLKPFSLGETEEYLKDRNILWSRYDIIELYMVMGGIPFYLSQLDQSSTLAKNIDDIFFKERGKLWNEFNNLYVTLFKNADAHIKVAEALASKKMGLTKSEISELTGLPCNGVLTKILDNLEGSGFVRSYVYFGNKKKETTYQLADFYTLFYYRFLKDSKRDENYWENSLDNPSRLAWAGYSFEQVCKDHLSAIRKKLGISGVLCEHSSWFSKGDADSGEVRRGCQIDLVIDRRDRVINICEMKFSRNEYVIDKDYDMNLRHKIGQFQRETKTRKAIQLTFVSPYGLKRGMYSSTAQSEVNAEDLFTSES